MRYTK